MPLFFSSDDLIFLLESFFVLWGMFPFYEAYAFSLLTFIVYSVTSIFYFLFWSLDFCTKCWNFNEYIKTYKDWHFILDLQVLWLCLSSLQLVLLWAFFELPSHVTPSFYLSLFIIFLEKKHHYKQIITEMTNFKVRNYILQKDYLGFSVSCICDLTTCIMHVVEVYWSLHHVGVITCLDNIILCVPSF